MTGVESSMNETRIIQSFGFPLQTNLFGRDPELVKDHTFILEYDVGIWYIAK